MSKLKKSLIIASIWLGVFSVSAAFMLKSAATYGIDGITFFSVMPFVLSLFAGVVGWRYIYNKIQK